MNDTVFSGEALILQIKKDAEDIRRRIPFELRGVDYERIFPGLSPYGATQKLQRSYTCEFADRNNRNEYHPLLLSILHNNFEPSQHPLTPQNEREWQVARHAVASFNQWLGTLGGIGHNMACFQKAGGQLIVVKYPKD